jgi:hypothetical protein
LRVTALPDGTDAVLVAFNDLDWPPLATDGGHGVIRVAVASGADVVDVPPVPELREANLPAGVTIAGHNRGRAPIGYRAPCGGGDKAHRYIAVVTAVSGTDSLDSCVVPLGSLDGVPAWVADFG